MPFSEVPACPAALVAGAPPTVVVPILMYHLIRVDSDPHDRLGKALSVTPADFATQMAWLHDHGAHSVSLGAVRENLAEGTALPANPVVLTFDDGFADFLTTAVPVLRRYNFSATVFVVTGFIKRPAHLSVAQLRTVAKDGMVIGAHTVDHPDLTTIPAAQAAREISDSRSALRGWTGQPVEDFAYPSGRHNPAVEKLVAAAGYRDAVTTSIGIDHSAADALRWSRVRVAGGETLDGFVRGLRVGFSGEPDPGCSSAAPALHSGGAGA